MPQGQSEGSFWLTRNYQKFMEKARGSGGDRMLRSPTQTVAVSETVSRTGTVGNTSTEGERDSPAIVGVVSAVRKRSHVRGLEQKVPSLARGS